jgi:hypothetical protein
VSVISLSSFDTLVLICLACLLRSRPDAIPLPQPQPQATPCH